MGGIEGSNKFIKFGTHKVETGKSDGVKRETVSGNGTKNKFIMDNIFQKFDKNADGYLDTKELEQVYDLLNQYAKNDKMSKKEARAIAEYLKMPGVQLEHIEQFVETLATENDGVSAQREGNKLTVKNGDSTIITVYSDDSPDNNKVVTKEQIISNDGIITSRQVDTFAEDGETVIKTEKFGPGGEKRIQTTEKNGDNTVKTDYNDAGKPSRVTVKNNTTSTETVTTYEWASDGTHTETTNGVVKRFDDQGKEIPDEPEKSESEMVTPETKQHKVKSGEHWYKIVQDEYGVKDHRTIMEIVHQLKDLAGPEYGKAKNYKNTSMPKELTLPTTVTLANGQTVTLTNPPEAVASQTEQSTEVVSQTPRGASQTEQSTEVVSQTPRGASQTEQSTEVVSDQPTVASQTEQQNQKKLADDIFVDEQIRTIAMKDSRVAEIADRLDEFKTNYDKLNQEYQSIMDFDSKTFNFDAVLEGPTSLDVGTAASKYNNARKALEAYNRIITNWQDGQTFDIVAGQYSGGKMTTVTLEDGSKGVAVETTAENGDRVNIYCQLSFDPEFGSASLFPGEAVKTEIIERAHEHEDVVSVAEEPEEQQTVASQSEQSTEVVTEQPVIASESEQNLEFLDNDIIIAHMEDKGCVVFQDEFGISVSYKGHDEYFGNTQAELDRFDIWVGDLNKSDKQNKAYEEDSFSDFTTDLNTQRFAHNTRVLELAQDSIGTIEVSMAEYMQMTPEQKQKTQIHIIGNHGASTEAWCAHTVSYLSEQAGMDIGGHKKSVASFITWARDNSTYRPVSLRHTTTENYQTERSIREGQIRAQLPDMHEGDYIIWKGKYAATVEGGGVEQHTSSHIGFIESVDVENGIVTVIEGNANEQISGDGFERSLVTSATEGETGAQEVGEWKEANKRDGIIRKQYTIADLAAFGYSGYIDNSKIVI